MKRLGERGYNVSSSSIGPDDFLYMSPKPSSRPVVNRRTFVAAGMSLAAAAMLPSRARAASRSPGAYPFSLGVASGDPSPNGVVIWTRLVPEPLEAGGGMRPEPVEVGWEVAEDEAMMRVVRRGTTTAEPAWAHSVHVEVGGLRPNRWYWYRFRAHGGASPKGRTRTLPSPDALPGRLRFAFASCQKYEMGYYTAYEHMVREDLDLVVFLGDYIYEKDDSSEAVRPHGLPAIRTLDDFRIRYAVYKSDPALQAAHAAVPWIATWDDHEVSNDYAGAVAEDPVSMPEVDFLLRRAAAYKAYYEHMPLRPSARPSGPDLRLFRRVDFGRLARFHVLDTRQYRTDQPPGPRRQKPGAALESAASTILGTAQREWLAEGLNRSPAVWNIIAQQVLMARVDSEPGPAVIVDVDKWAGYEHERRWLLRYLRDKKVSNPVVITGDIHSNWAIELTDDFDQAAARTVAVEFVGTSISSSGHGFDQPGELAALMEQNPSVKFQENKRGYVRCEATPTVWRTDFQTVPYIDRRGAPLETSASFVVEAGDPHLQRVDSK